MTWEEKLAALQCLANTRLAMRAPGDWYVDAVTRRTTDGHGVLIYDTGYGKSPQEAVESDWDKIAVASQQQRVKVLVGQRSFMWAGYMWVELTEPETNASS